MNDWNAGMDLNVVVAGIWRVVVSKVVEMMAAAAAAVVVGQVA